jgi:hypothetical protein
MSMMDVPLILTPAASKPFQAAAAAAAAAAAGIRSSNDAMLP